ncbi:MAG TPA: hypothetical protein VLL52_04255 [Anaerolineae bacterium]|nr:hypothetical protein [Anaerolineae bacterium]
MSIKPGINPESEFDHFPNEEHQIIKQFSREWYVTNAGSKFSLANSEYRYFLIKPTSLYTEMFNIEREVAVVFDPYRTFQPRALDAIDTAINNYQTVRVERIISILISKDKNIEAKIERLLNINPETRIIVPFYYEELNTNVDDFFIRNRFKKHSYTRDLFAFESPLKKDLYFFGRQDLVLRIANRHRSNENSGLFGLRKTGKTSVVFGISRTLETTGDKSVFIDCQNPAFHQRRWYHALHYIVQEIKSQYKLPSNTKNEERFTPQDAPILFERELRRIHRELNKKSLLLIFDEIENISHDISPSPHWATDLDFVYFWQTLRSLFQKLNNVFSYLIVGTNPRCIEQATIKGKDNPIFNQVAITYMPSFDIVQTRQMVRKLGRVMGLKFDELIYAKLTEDYGGHPFLIRHICSEINKVCDINRPATVDTFVYQEAKEIFDRNSHNYIEMILNVLKLFYADEYSMLEYLASGDQDTFKEFSDLSPYYTNHLLGYEIIKTNGRQFAIKIDVVKQYLISKNKYRKINLSEQEMWLEVSQRRNQIEVKLRSIVRRQLQIAFGQDEAKQKVLKIYGKSGNNKYRRTSYKDLFNPNKVNVYFDDIRKLIITNWDLFKNIFETDQQATNAILQTINKYRVDAHAKSITSDEMAFFRSSIIQIEEALENF